MLRSEPNDVCMIGMYGLAGIGKTTLAKAIYNKIVDEFEDSCFVKNVRETSDVAQLQENLLHEILGYKIELFKNCDRGIIVIKERLCSRKLLIVVDDVSNVHQLQKLAGATHWFGAGSRIIITTTDEHVLVAHGVEKRYMVKGLSYKDALELFCWKAFKEPQPREDFMDLSHQMVRYADGHPLALEVLGSFLCGRNIPQWESELDRLKRGPKKQIYDILIRSYDCLDHDDKAIFLDIACFFKDIKIDNVMTILKVCGFDPDIGMPVLIERSLILIENGMLRMHGLVQSMGKQVAQQQSPVPGGRRLCFHSDINDIAMKLTENMGTSEIEGIKIDVPSSEEPYLKAEVFAKLKRLRILIVSNAHITGHLESLPNLRLLELSGCSLELVLSEFHPRKLVSLDMHRSNIRQFGDGFKGCTNLKSIDFRYCQLLTEIHDLSTIPNLVRLDCTGCSNLRSLPSSLGLKFLETLNFDRCSKLENFPNVLVTMKSLRDINLCGTAIKGLPSSIENLVGLEFLYLSGCRNLACIPSTIFKLFQLKELSAQACSKLVMFPVDEGIESESDILPNLERLYFDRCENLVKIHPSIGHLERLGVLRFDGCSELRSFPSSLNLKSLEQLVFSGCSNLKNFPDVSGAMKSLAVIDLHGSGIKDLPSSIENLAGLEYLIVSDCRNLAFIPSTIFKLSQLTSLDVSGCSKLFMFSADKGVESGSNSMMYLEPDILPTSHENSCSNYPLINLDSAGCCQSPKVDLPMISNWFPSLRRLDLSGQNFVSLPSWIYRLTSLTDLMLRDCQQLREIRELPQSITSLYVLDCKSLERSLPSSRVLFNRTTFYHKIFQFINCHKLAENQGKAFMSSLSSSLVITSENEGFFKGSHIDVVLPGSDIPEWLNYYNEEDYISFELPSCMCKKLLGLAFFIIVRLKPEEALYIKMKINGQAKSLYVNNVSVRNMCVTMESDHLWFRYMPSQGIISFQSLLRYDCSNDFELSVEVYDHSKKTYLKMRKWGVFLVCRQDEKVGDPRLIHEDIDTPLETSSDDDEPMCKRKRTMIMDAEV